ncbi:MAG: LysR family transcriptional regulator [Rhodospirillaceae bacterium]
MRHLTTFRYIDEVAKVRSIRKAAETLAITPSALNRRILMFEEELGGPIFERLPRGVRLNTAGEILIHHIRNQISDMDRVRSQIADVAGVRRGHVSLACPQPALRFFLPSEIKRYREGHPEVTFNVHVRNGLAAEQALADHSADIAILAEAPYLAEFQTVLTIRQPVYVVMADDHPLTKEKSPHLSECLEYPLLALPPTPNALRSLLEGLAAQRSAKINLAVQSDSYEFLLNYVRAGQVLSFYLPLGLPADKQMEGRVCRPISSRDAPPVLLYLGQLRNRHLSVAASRFCDQLVNAFVKAYDCD